MPDDGAQKQADDSQPAPKAADAPERAAPPPQSGKSSLFWWLALIVIAGGGYYSYTKGWLDEPLRRMGVSEKAQETETPKPQETVAQAPATSSISAAGMSEILTQLNAMQSRISSLEGTTRNLQAISEDLADQLVRQTGGQVAGSPGSQNRLRLELIDLRLRITGDTLSAISELESLGTGVDESSQLGVLISTNRSRLSQTPSRVQVLGQVDTLDRHIAQAVADVEGRLSALEDENKQASAEGGILRALFKVRKTDAGLQRELALAKDLANAAESVRPALLSGIGPAYLGSLREVTEAADALRNHNATLHTTEISGTLAQLAELGFPETHLVLEPQGQS